MMDAERFLLKWNNHQSNLVTVFDQLYEQEAFTDVTLACDGRSFAAHKVILSACSPYFQQLFLSNPCKHPIIFMRDVRACDLDALLAFMYRGEINVHQQDLASFLKTAESLQIKGLSDSSDKPRDTSKILEAMEKKFSSSCSSGVSSSNNMTMGAALGTLMSNALSHNNTINNNTSTNRSSPMGGRSAAATHTSSSCGINALNRSLMSHAHAHAHPNHHSSPLSPSGPPEKKFKPTPEEFTRILPKIKSLVSSQSLMAPLPGLITPITLAATVMKTAAHPPSLPLPYLPALENNNSPSHNPDSVSPKKDIKKEGFISGDSPHPVYLVSSVGGLGLNSSGNSTPSHEVKVEEEDPLEENAFSDDPGSLGPNDVLDGHALETRNKEDTKPVAKTETCQDFRFEFSVEENDLKINIEPLEEVSKDTKISPVFRTQIPVDVLDHYLNNVLSNDDDLADKNNSLSCEKDCADALGGSNLGHETSEMKLEDEEEEFIIGKREKCDDKYVDSDIWDDVKLIKEEKFSDLKDELKEEISLVEEESFVPDPPEILCPDDAGKSIRKNEVNNETPVNSQGVGNLENKVEASSLTKSDGQELTENKPNAGSENQLSKKAERACVNVDLLPLLHRSSLGTPPDEMSLLKTVMSGMEASGEDLRKNPEFLNCLVQEVKIKLIQERLERERPVEMIGLKDHTYMMPRYAKKHSGSAMSWHECQYCQRKFPPNRRHRYLSHLRVHSGERPFKCTICHRGFNRQDHLNVHMRLHTGEKPFSCPECKLSFTHKTSLSHHKCQKGKPFKCRGEKRSKQISNEV